MSIGGHVVGFVSRHVLYGRLILKTPKSIGVICDQNLILRFSSTGGGEGHGDTYWGASHKIYIAGES